MRLKPGVKVAGIAPEIVLAAVIAQSILGDVELVITSALDGKHSVHSRHYQGNAIDIRTRDLVPTARQEFRDKLADALGPDFDVVLESDHLHVELDPKTEAIA